MLRYIASKIVRYVKSPYWTKRRLINWLLLELHERLRLARIRAYPDKLIIETINACDGTCKLCPVGEGRRSRPARVLDMALYQRFIDELAPYAREVHLENWGEPTLDPHLVARIRYAHKRNLYTFVSTTLHRISPAGAEALVSSGLDRIAISLHAVSQKTYESYQPGHSLDGVLANVRMLVAARTKLGMETPRVTLLFVRSRQNADELHLIPALVRDLGADDSLIGSISINGRFLWSDLSMNPRELTEQQFQDELRARAETWLPDDVLSDFDPTLRAIPKLPTCDRLWRMGVLNSDGAVPPCCDVFRPENNFGNYDGSQAFQKIWNNDRFLRARRSFGARPPTDQELICLDCPGHGSKLKFRNSVRF
jgi:MoaA/NifB/PqqE/SkfB family radical SAM enzyme